MYNIAEKKDFIQTLQDINEKSSFDFLSYTVKINPMDLLTVLPNQLYKKDYKIFLENNKTNQSFIAFGSNTEINIQNSRDLKI